MSQESTSRGLYEDEFWSSAEFDIEFEFEFDAPQFYDFSRSELDSETKEIDKWFESSGNYPPSPFSPKIKWKLEAIKESRSTSSEFKSVQNTTPITKSSNSSPNRYDKYNGFIYYNQKVKDVSKTETKSKSKSKTKTKLFASNSTLQRPTASLLARQNKLPLDIYSLQLLRRCQRSLGKFDDKISSSLSQNQDPKKSINKRPKLTVPKEPNLRTAARSERHKSKVNLETQKNTKSSSKSNNKAKNSAIQESNCSKSKMLKVIDSPKRNDIRKIKSQANKSKISTLNPKVMQISSQDPWECPFLYHQNKEEELNQTIPSDFSRLFKECDASMDTSSKDDSFIKPFSQICLSSSNLHTPVPSVVQTLVA